MMGGHPQHFFTVGFLSSDHDQLARLLDAADATARDTIVLYTSDHGDLLGCTGVPRAKWQPMQNAYRNPLIVYGPGG